MEQKASQLFGAASRHGLMATVEYLLETQAVDIETPSHVSCDSMYVRRGKLTDTAFTLAIAGRNATVECSRRFLRRKEYD